MHGNGAVRAAAIAGLFTAISAGGAAARQRSVERDFEHLGRDVLFLWASPARIGVGDAQALGTAGAALAASYFGDEPVFEWLRTHRDAAAIRLLAPFRDEAPGNLLGRSVLLIPLSAALYASGLAFDSEGLRDAGLGCAAADAASVTIRLVLMHVTGRLRPRYDGGHAVFLGPGLRPWQYQSFPGGHAANIMSCVSYWNRRFDLNAAGALLYGVAGAVAIGRMVDEEHWLSDTVAGLTLGYAIGKAMALRVRGRDRPAAERATAPSLYLGWRISF